MITVGGSGVSDFIRGVCGSFGTELDGGARGEVSGAMMTGKPIGGKRDPLVDRLLDPKLATGFVSAGDNVGCEIKGAEGQPGLSFQSLRKFTVEIIAGVIAAVLHGNEDVVSQHEGPAVLAAIVSLPLNRRRGRSLRRTG